MFSLYSASHCYLVAWFNQYRVEVDMKSLLVGAGVAAMLFSGVKKRLSGLP